MISAEDLENQIKQKITDYRMSTLLISPIFDDNLAYLLSPALCNYELERVCGLTFGDDEFKTAISQAIPDGHTFKAFPVQTQGIDANKIMTLLLQGKVYKTYIFNLSRWEKIFWIQKEILLDLLLG